MDMQEYFNAQLRRERANRQVSLEEFAKELGIGKSTLQKYEKGLGNPTLETVQMIAGQLHREPGCLLGFYSRSEIEAAALVFKLLDWALNLPNPNRAEFASLILEMVALLGKSAMAHPDPAQEEST